MSDAMHPQRAATPLLDLHHPDIEALVTRRGRRTLSAHNRIGAVDDFVRHQIAFGDNEGDALPAPRVLADGIGQCNTKSTLLMALLRAVDIPCRVHGLTIDKPLQKGAVTGVADALAPQRIVHSWVEVSLESRWIAHEGFILDAPDLASLQRRFCGDGVATPDLSAPGVEWRGQDTCIQKEGIADDVDVVNPTARSPGSRRSQPRSR